MRRRILPTTGALLLLFCLTARAPHAQSSFTWLDRLNFYRATAALPPVAEDPRLSHAVRQHARYMVMHDVIAHSQKARLPWSTRAGAAAAAVSNLAGSTRATEPEAWAVDEWMQAPFHALGILDPALNRVGFGIHRAPNGGIQTAAGLDVVRGRGARAAATRFPIVWPANGASVPLTKHTDEYPSPLTSCDGYTAPTGLPLIVQLGSGARVPRVTHSWLLKGDQELDHCTFDESTYRNGDRRQQALGRRILAARDAIVVIPRQPLRAGATYRAVVKVDGRLVDWTFSVDDGVNP